MHVHACDADATSHAACAEFATQHRQSSCPNSDMRTPPLCTPEPVNQAYDLCGGACQNLVRTLRPLQCLFIMALYAKNAFWNILERRSFDKINHRSQRFFMMLSLLVAAKCCIFLQDRSGELEIDEVKAALLSDWPSQ